MKKLTVIESQISTLTSSVSTLSGKIDNLHSVYDLKVAADVRTHKDLDTRLKNLEVTDFDPPRTRRRTGIVKVEMSTEQD